jgi:hypothetical protein
MQPEYASPYCMTIEVNAANSGLLDGHHEEFKSEDQRLLGCYLHFRFSVIFSVLILNLLNGNVVSALCNSEQFIGLGNNKQKRSFVSYPMPFCILGIILCHAIHIVCFLFNTILKTSCSCLYVTIRRLYRLLRKALKESL